MPTKPIRRILLVRPDRLGDLLMNLPLIHRLKTNHPTATLALVCAQSWAPLFHHHLDVNQVIGLEPGAGPGSILRQLKAGKYDCAVITAPDKAWHWTLFRLGIPIRAGFDRKWGRLLTHRIPDDKAVSGRHEADSNLAAVDSICPARWNGRMELGLDMHARRKDILASLNLIPGKKLIVFHLSSTNAAKEIPPAVFAEVISKLLEKPRYQVIVVGSEPGPAPTAAMLKLFQNEPQFVDLTGRTDITKLALLLKEAHCVVTTDSGPLHLAWIQKTPTVALFVEGAEGSTPQRWGVYPGFAPSQVIQAPQNGFESAAILNAIHMLLGEAA
jgi:heptosyltransferase-2